MLILHDPPVTQDVGVNSFAVLLDKISYVNNLFFLLYELKREILLVNAAMRKQSTKR